MDNATFRIDWLDWQRKVYATDTVRRHDLTDAITAAANMLKRGAGESASAHGFFVQVER